MRKARSRRKISSAGQGGNGNGNGGGVSGNGNGNGNGDASTPISTTIETNNNNHNNNTNNHNHTPHEELPLQRRRAPTPEEAALTAKNYRLAKELSDLRVRHREETKNVTKLTMENMNLASRCRQAMAHAEMLQKELSKHHPNKTSETKRHRQSSKRYPLESSHNLHLNNSSVLEGTTTPSDKDGNLYNHSTHSTPHQHQHQNQPQDSTVTEPTAGTSKAKVLSVVVKNDNVDRLSSDYDIPETNHESSSPSPPRSSHKNESIRENSIVPVTNNSSHDHDGADVAFGELHSADFFSPTSYENTLPTTPEKENVDMNIGIGALNDEFRNFNLAVSINENGSNEDNNSFDAFEASFTTDFPLSFTTTIPSERSLSLEEVFSESDSFFTNSHGENPSSSSSSPPPPQRGVSMARSTSAERTTSGNRNGNDTPNKKSSKSNPDNELELFPPSPLDSFVNSPDSIMSTPSPKKGRYDDKGTGTPPSPPSDKRAGIAAAKARYLYALSDTDENIAPMDEAHADKSETSPTLVLQRLQQRKAKDKSGSGGPSLSDLATNAARNKNFSEEIRKLDAIASGTHSGPLSRIKSGSGSRRRGVKQPISYAEPSLSSKLRRGDVFFPKNDVTNAEAANSKATVTS